jgi:PAS domain S-box-containing protein
MQVNESHSFLSSEEKFSALFEYASEGIIVIDSAGKILLSNPACEKLFGYHRGDLIGKPVEILIPKRFSNHSQHRENYSKKPHPRSMGIGLDLFGKHNDGHEIPIEISLSPFNNNGQQFVIGFIIDITIRKKNEEIQKKQKAELQELANELDKRVKDRTMILEEALHELESSREELSIALEKEKELNELKTRFVSMASHEFRTPLATILSSLSLVTKYGEIGEKDNQIKHINRIKSSITHLTDILNDMLSLSKLEEGKIIASPELFNIKDFTTHVIQELQAVVKHGQQIHFHHSGNQEVYLDHKILKNILFNLVSNAIKFSRESSNVEVFTKVDESLIEIKVKDYGIGIPEEDQEHLFERFFRGHNASNIQGTGLGLNIVARYVELMNGNITFESKYEKGTTFIIKLPNYIEQ